MLSFMHNSQSLQITPVFLPRQVSFLVQDQSGYLFTLVPSAGNSLGFNLSPRDIALGIPVDFLLLNKVAAFIESYYE